MSVPVPFVFQPVRKMQPISSTEPTITSTYHPQPIDILSPQKGPFCTLGDRAGESKFGQRLKSHFPQASSTLSAMHGVLVKADKGVRTIGDLMATTEGRRLSTATVELMMSFLVFSCMVLRIVFTEIANYLDIRVEDSPKTLSILLCKIVSKVGQKICDKASAHENDLKGTSREKIFVCGRLVNTFMFNAVMCMLGGMLRFDGPGKEYVLPLAENVVGLMPASVEASVKEIDGPMRVMRKCLKCMELGNDSAAEGAKTE